MPENIIEFKNITKRFGGTTALDQVSFTAKKGEVTGLIGENGAGKSTLIKICGGVIEPNEGQVFYEGEEIKIESPRMAEKLGISIVHQELPICENMTVAQNIFLGPDIPGGKIFPDKKFMHKRTKELFSRLNIEIPVNKLVSKCSLGQKQMIIIAKSLARDANFVLMDEPTTALSPDEIDVLYDVLQRLTEEGISVLFVSHRLNEVIKVSDRICALKDGKYVGDISKDEATEDKLASMMVGRDVETINKKASFAKEEKILEVKNLNQEKIGLKDISFDLKKGEVLGFAGLQGAGRSELARTLIGNFKLDSGEIYLKGEKVDINSPKKAIEYGIGYLPEDRGNLGLFKKLDVKTNLCIANIDNLSNYYMVNNKKIRETTNKFKDQLDIKLRSISQNIDSLSGGNQQKVLLARWLSLQPEILILDEPTRGIDVGTKNEIRKLIIDLVEKGYSIIMISSEMTELLSIADRILVMSRGHITGEFTREEATEEKIMKAAVQETLL